jgi:hypothetical protein
MPLIHILKRDYLTRASKNNKIMDCLTTDKKNILTTDCGVTNQKERHHITLMAKIAILRN